MSKKNLRLFECQVVNEPVRIFLKQARSIGLRSVRTFFVQCDQMDCQYVTENKAPCPLATGLFADEIAGIEQKERQRREEKLEEKY